MAPRKPRHLSTEERQLWDRVARTTRPNPTRSKPDETGSVTASPRPKTEPTVGLSFEPFRIGQKAFGSVAAEEAVTSPVRMDRRTYQRMKRGKMKPEGRIDLHGMTQSAAHSALTHFILAAHAEGKRLVLVITGKGRRRDDTGPIPERVGVLRHQVPHWLDLPPLRSKVLQVSEAHVSHGGGGAYYVYLSRQR